MKTAPTRVIKYKPFVKLMTALTERRLELSSFDPRPSGVDDEERREARRRINALGAESID